MGGLGLITADGQAFGTVELSSFSSGTVNAGVMIRYQDANHWYNAYQDGTNLVSQSDSSGTHTVASTTFTASVNTLYDIRIRLVGNELSAKAWAATIAEPAAWSVVAIDNDVTGTGQAGAEVTDVSGAVANYTAFSGTSIL